MGLLDNFQRAMATRKGVNAAKKYVISSHCLGNGSASRRMAAGCEDGPGG